MRRKDRDNKQRKSKPFLVKTGASSSPRQHPRLRQRQQRPSRNSDHDDNDDIVAQLQRQRQKQAETCTSNSSSTQQEQQEGKESANPPKMAPEQPKQRFLGKFEYCAICNSYFPIGSHSHSYDGNGGDERQEAVRVEPRFRSPPFTRMLLHSTSSSFSDHHWHRLQPPSYYLPATLSCSDHVRSIQRSRLVEEWRARILFDSFRITPPTINTTTTTSTTSRPRHLIPSAGYLLPLSDQDRNNLDQFQEDLPAWCRTFDVITSDENDGSGDNDDDGFPLIVSLCDNCSVVMADRYSCQSPTFRNFRNNDAVQYSAVRAFRIPYPSATAHTNRAATTQRQKHNAAAVVGVLATDLEYEKSHVVMRPHRSARPANSTHDDTTFPFIHDWQVSSQVAAVWNDFCFHNKKLVLAGDLLRPSTSPSRHLETASTAKRAHGPWIVQDPLELGRVNPSLAQQCIVNNFPASNTLCVQPMKDHPCHSYCFGHLNGAIAFWDDRTNSCRVASTWTSTNKTTKFDKSYSLGNILRLLPLEQQPHQVLVRGYNIHHEAGCCQLWDVRMMQKIHTFALPSSTATSTSTISTQRSTGLAVDPSETVVFSPFVDGAQQLHLGVWSLMHSGEYMGSCPLLPPTNKEQVLDKEGTTTTKGTVAPMGIVTVELCDRVTAGWEWRKQPIEEEEEEGKEGEELSAAGGGAWTVSRKPGTFGLWYRLFGCDEQQHHETSRDLSRDLSSAPSSSSSVSSSSSFSSSSSSSSAPSSSSSSSYTPNIRHIVFDGRCSVRE